MFVKQLFDKEHQKALALISAPAITAFGAWIAQPDAWRTALATGIVGTFGAYKAWVSQSPDKSDNHA